LYKEAIHDFIKSPSPRRRFS